jgi:hypothetical protein
MKLRARSTTLQRPPTGRRPGCFAVAVDHCNDRAEHRFFEQPPRGRE